MPLDAQTGRPTTSKTCLAAVVSHPLSPTGTRRASITSPVLMEACWTALVCTSAVRDNQPRPPPAYSTRTRARTPPPFRLDGIADRHDRTNPVGRSLRQFRLLDRHLDVHLFWRRVERQSLRLELGDGSNSSSNGTSGGGGSKVVSAAALAASRMASAIHAGFLILTVLAGAMLL
jgi:hypothetical protein